MGKQIYVTYELILADRTGEEFTESFSHSFESDIYCSDVETTDIMMVNFKMQDLKEKYGDVVLVEFSIERGGDYH